MTELTKGSGANTLAEILSQPEMWKKCIAGLDRTRELHRIASKLPSGRESIFIGCGSSYYVGLTAAATWSLLSREPSRAVPASEILLFPNSLPQNFSAILISRSGHTSEVIETGKLLQQQNRTPPVAITCANRTPIEDVAAEIVVLPEADEKSTVMTRSFTSMLLALQMLAAERAEAAEFSDGIRALPREMEQRVAEIGAAVRRLVEFRQFEDYVFLGQGPFFGIAREAMLKVTEMSCSYAQCFHTLEFRHGPKAIVGPETLVTFFLSESGFQAEVPVLQEMKQLGAMTLVVTNQANRMVHESADCLIEMSLRAPELARVAAFAIPGQLLGFHTGIRKGFDPDNPRHLSRVVVLRANGDGESGRGAG